MLSALPLLPEAEVRQGLENIKEFVDEMPLRAVEILNYLETVFIGGWGAMGMLRQRVSVSVLQRLDTVLLLEAFGWLRVMERDSRAP